MTGFLLEQHIKSFKVTTKKYWGESKGVKTSQTLARQKKPEDVLYARPVLQFHELLLRKQSNKGLIV
jgi:hypothetical protein